MVLQYPPAHELPPVVVATCAYFALYYAFLFAQSYVKIYLVQTARNAPHRFRFTDVHYTDPAVAKIKYGSVPTQSGALSRLALVADRTVGNTCEQALPFLCATWLHALLVPGGASASAALAWIYVLARALYPLFFWIGHPYLQVSTVPGYLVILVQLASVLAAAADIRLWDRALEA